MKLLHELGRRTLSTHPVAWADSGPLFTEHIIFSSGGMDEGIGPPRLAVILHGLLGAGRNLRTFTTELFKEASKKSDATWTAVMVDLRNHGKSAQRSWLEPPHTLRAAAHDVINTVKNNWKSNGGQIDALIGHSLGGKVALEVTKELGAANAPLPPVRQTWCLDSVPGKVLPPIQGTSAEVLNVLQAVSEIPLPIPSREWLLEELERRGHKNKVFQQWLASNLRVQGPGEYTWTFNVDGASKLFESYRHNDYFDLLKSPPADSEIHLIKAMKGGRWNGKMAEKLDQVAAQSDRGRTQVHEMPNVGHWLHAEDPKGLAQMLLPHIVKLG